MRQELITFARRETVLCITAVLAALSMCFVPPDAGYLDYLNSVLWGCCSVFVCRCWEGWREYYLKLPFGQRHGIINITI